MLKIKYSCFLVPFLMPFLVNAQSRNDAGLSGDAGAVSGFFDANVPVNFPTEANSWWHLLDVRHSNHSNNFAMQFAGSFYDQHLYFRKTINDPGNEWSRILLERGGKVGIGRLDPQYALDIKGEDYKQLRLSGGNTMIKFSNSAFNNGDGAEFWQTNDGNFALNLTSNKRIITFTNNGVGIGTTTPESSLDINSGTNNNQLSLIKNTIVGEEGPGILFKNLVNNGVLTEIGGVQAKLLSGTNNFVASSLSFYTAYNSSKIEAITISPNGNTGLGTTSPKERLAVNGNISVNGKIGAKEVKVEAKDWPDYVFAKDYVLPTLAETEKHIKEKGHLSEMPSAKDVENNGLVMGEMLKLQQKKIEELTLYMIQKDKEVIELKKQNKLLNDKVDLIIKKLK
ncbi:hypothetical protein [Pedobacter nototheniae]|uniref:hypothetical protein n=1 Tax=Pedobacter nototheniae TaxID=2488994 RepID=UPI00103DCBFA|nr:hypothetical protein [Pedobacter nototheniae]